MNYQVLHRIPGRLRLQISCLRWDTAFANQLTSRLESLPGITQVRINPAAASLVLNYQPGQLPEPELLFTLETGIQKLRQPPREGITFAGAVSASEDGELEPEINHWRDLGMPVLSLGVALLAAPLELPAVVVGMAIAGAALPWVIRAVDGLVNHHQPNIDLLDSLWMGLQTLRGNYAAPALKTVMVEARRSLRGTTLESQTKVAQELLAWFNQPYQIQREGQILDIPINTIQPGDLVQVAKGERIPVDGWVIAGTAFIDEHSFTANHTPNLYHPGQEVYAATRIVSGQLTLIAQRAGINSRMGLAAKLIQEMPVHDTQLGTQQAEFTRAMIFPTIFFGGAMFALTGSFAAAVSPFQLDFGSGIPISVHTTFLAALTYAAHCGIYIRSARILEHLSQLDAIVLDANVLDALAIDDACPHESYTTLKDLGLEVHEISSVQHTPNQIADLVAGLRHQGKTVAFIGQPNSTASAQASVAIAFALDQEISRVDSDIVIMTNQLEAVQHAIAIAKRAVDVVYQNTAIIVVPNLLIQVGGGMILGVNPVINVITNNSSAFVAEFIHGARPLFDKYTPAPATFPNQPPRQQLPNRQLPESSAPLLSNLVRSIKQRDLAKRLGVPSQALTSRRSKSDFRHWVQTQDPEGQAWQYDAATKCFYSV